MKGMNQFTSKRLLEKRASSSVIECVFISYSRLDRDEALIVAKMIQDLGIDIYFDENDEALQLADEQGNHEKVVECIENGIAHSTLLLGIITENTKKSWWVPYEIGSANGRKQPHAHLITKKVTHVPSYIQASTILPSMTSLDEWLLANTQSKLGRLSLLLERLERGDRSNYKSASTEILSWSRSINDLVFY